MRLGLDLKHMDRNIRNIVNDALKHWIELIYTESMAKAPGGVRQMFTVDINTSEMRVELWTENELAAYLEFGTGGHAAALLSGKPIEMQSEAMKFFVSGKGKLEARPYLFTTYYKYAEQIPKDIDNRIQKYLDKL